MFQAWLKKTRSSLARMGEARLFDQVKRRSRSANLKRASRVVESGGKVEIENAIIFISRFANEIEVACNDPGARE
jgi:hypothetical protein